MKKKLSNTLETTILQELENKRKEEEEKSAEIPT